MKKIGIALLAALFITSCTQAEAPSEETTIEGVSEEEYQALKEENEALKEELEALKNEPEKPEEEETPEASEENYGLGEVWEVPDKWKITVNSVTTTDERNMYSDQEPAEVVTVHYTYENLGYDDEGRGLYVYPERIMDAEGKMGYDYPVSVTEYPQETPIGGTCDAEQNFGIANASETVKVYFEVYDEEYTRHLAVFEVPVE